jgi:hypothetical protein
MLKKNFDRNYNEIAEEALSIIKKEGQRLVKSGAIELKNYPDNYLLPKTILVLALENCINQYSFNPESVERLHGKEVLNDIRNLRCF